MKEIILQDTLAEYLRAKLSKADELLCSEEYRAGYVEAVNEIFLYLPFLTVKPKKRLF